jgi:hypothetical protein
MNAEIVTPLIIKKENIVWLLFPPQEVLTLPNEIKDRKANAQKGLLLGNNYKGKVKIIFEDTESLKRVETTIWGLTDMHVILKGGISIPLHRIYSVTCGI